MQADAVLGTKSQNSQVKTTIIGDPYRLENTTA